MLSHIEFNTLHTDLVNNIDFHAIGNAKTDKSDLFNLQSDSSNSLQLKAFSLPNSNSTIVCDASTGVPHQLISSSLRTRKVLSSSIWSYSLSHPSIRATQQLISYFFLCMASHQLGYQTGQNVICSTSNVKYCNTQLHYLLTSKHLIQDLIMFTLTS